MGKWDPKGPKSRKIVEIQSGGWHRNWKKLNRNDFAVDCSIALILGVWNIVDRGGCGIVEFVG